MPKTRLGTWSVRSLLAFLVLFVLLQVLRAIGEEPGRAPLDSPWWSLTLLCAAAAAVAAFGTGIVSIITQRERSVSVFIATGIGLLMILALVADALSSA